MADVTFGGASSSVAFEEVAVPTINFATSGSDRVGILHIAGAIGTITGVTWGGIAMTSIGTFAAGTGQAWMYYIVAPAIAASDIIVTHSVATQGAACVSYYNNVDQANPIRAGSFGTDGAVGGETSSVVCSCVAGDMGIDAAGVFGGDLTAPLGTQIFLTQSTGTSFVWGGGARRAAVGSTVTMGWTGDDDIAMVAAALAAAAGGGPVSVYVPGTPQRNVRHTGRFM